VSEHIADLLEQRGLVEQWLRGVPSLPEGSPPSHKRTDLFRDVGQEVLHELRQVALRRPNNQVQVIRSKGEGKQFDPVESDGARQYTPEDVVGLPRWTEKEPSLKAPNRGEVNGRSLKHAERSAHLVPPARLLEHEPRQRTRK
jgi:hypothetical protein